jgi:hypothetical protein
MDLQNAGLDLETSAAATLQVRFGAGRFRLYVIGSLTLCSHYNQYRAEPAKKLLALLLKQTVRQVYQHLITFDFYKCHLQF